jgi:cytochrome b6-f complex iron-sulfur subunit
MDEKNQPGSNPKRDTPTLGRRQLITYLLGFSVISTLAGVLTPIVGYLWPPARAAGSGGGRVEVGSTIDFPAGQGRVVPVNDQPVIVINTPQGMRAYSAICTHLGCVVEWDQARQFVLCPCHDGRFNALNGAIISGPVPAPLPQLSVTVENDLIYVSETS